MTMTAIPALLRTSATFKTEVDTFFATKIPLFVTEANALEANVVAKEASAVASAATAVAQAAASAASAAAASASTLAAAAYDNATGTSITSMAISVANGKAFTTQSGKSWVAGMPVIAYNSSSNYMTCTVASYVGTTLTLDCTAIFGTGTFAVWSLFAPAPVQGSMVVRDEKANGTNGGTPTIGWNTRTLNTVAVNTIAGASLASNQVTLPAGTYDFDASAPALSPKRMVLYNATDSVALVVGMSCMNHFSIVSGRFTLSATKAITLRQYIGTGGGGDLGQAVSTGDVEVFAQLQIWRVS